MYSNIEKYKFFKYKGKMYGVFEMNFENKNFKCARYFKDGLMICIINSNLTESEKSKKLHKLIKSKRFKNGFTSILSLKQQYAKFM